RADAAHPQRVPARQGDDQPGSTTDRAVRGPAHAPRRQAMTPTAAFGRAARPGLSLDHPIKAQVRADLPGYAGSVLVTPMTSLTDGCEHAVPDVELSRARGAGRYQALCATQVVPGSLFDPPGRPCGRCVAHLHTPTPARCAR